MLLISGGWRICDWTRSRPPEIRIVSVLPVKPLLSEAYATTAAVRLRRVEPECFCVLYSHKIVYDGLGWTLPPRRNEFVPA